MDKMILKRMAALIFTVLLMGSLCACGGSAGTGKAVVAEGFLNLP